MPLLTRMVIAGLALMCADRLPLAQPSGAEIALELIDPKHFRVCADPNNLPFSNEKGEGFENKLAELFATKLGKTLTYVFYPQATGFVRNTLGSHRCDVIMGFPQSDDLVQSTNPYYHTTYAILIRKSSGLDGLTMLSDERLKGKRIGIVAGTPPATILTAYGLMPTAKSYPLVIDTRFASSARDMVSDLTAGGIDAGILWGPMAAYFARSIDPSLSVIPLTRERAGPRLDYWIGLGVRASDQNWKRQLSQLVQQNQKAIDALLTEFGVPLYDDGGQPKNGVNR